MVSPGCPQSVSALHPAVILPSSCPHPRNGFLDPSPPRSRPARRPRPVILRGCRPAFPASRARLAFGSDWFVAPPAPLDGIYAAVTRRTLDGAHPGGWVPEQRITVEEALRAYTAGGAFAGFADADLGTLEAGKLADFALIDRDLTRVPPETLRDARVVLTVVGGRVVHEAAPDARAGH